MGMALSYSYPKEISHPVEFIPRCQASSATTFTSRLIVFSLSRVVILILLSGRLSFIFTFKVPQNGFQRLDFDGSL